MIFERFVLLSVLVAVIEHSTADAFLHRRISIGFHDKPMGVMNLSGCRYISVIRVCASCPLIRQHFRVGVFQVTALPVGAVDQTEDDSLKPKVYGHRNYDRVAGCLPLTSSIHRSIAEI